jgi:predicted lipoprotein with Yx(FWY)xxD motif
MRISRAAASMLGLALIVSACSSSGATNPPSTSATAPPGGSPTATQPATGLTVALASTSLGTVLVGVDGLTLYVFTADAGGTSTCYDQCAATWPPLTSDTAPALGDGLSAADFGTTTRTDGSKQITFHGMPLYYYAGDKAAGDTNGQGLLGKWFVVDGQGQMIKQASPSQNAGY